MAKKPVESIEEKRPVSVRTDILPTEGHSVEVDGKLKTQFSDRESAVEAGTQLKKQFPFLQIRIYDAKERTRTPIELPTT